MNDIYNDNFWKERAEKALLSGLLHQTVFHTSLDEWQKIHHTNLQFIQQYIKPTVDTKILDAACGYGRAIEFFSNSQYTGIDISPFLIDLAHQIYPGGNFHVGDLRKLSYETKSFDWALAISLKVMVIRECGLLDWQNMENELKRVAKHVMLLEYTQGENGDVPLCTIL
jgi:SAM-dependent methyltransferase